MAEVVSTCRGILRGILNGVVCENQINWYAPTAHPNTASNTIAVAIRDQIWTAMQPLVTVHFTLLSVTAWYADFNGVQKPQFELLVNQQGTITGSDYLPPHDVVYIMKIPDNSETTPPDQPEFKLGRHGFSGVLEGDVSLGQLSLTAQGLWNTFGETLETLTVNDGSGDVDYTLGTFRPASVNGVEAYVYTAETYARPKIGTLNSRK